MPNVKAPQKILVVAPAWVGDMVMAQTLFSALRQRYPECLLHVLAPKWSHPLLERMLEVDHSIEAPFARGKFDWKARRALGLHLREESYNQAILCTNSWKSALVPYFAHIPQRTGWRGEWRYGLLNDVRHFDSQQYPRMVQRFMMLAFDKGREIPVQDFKPPRLICKPESIRHALQKYAVNPEEKPVLALCPGAEFGASKRWPEAHYAQVAKTLLEWGWQIWLFGSKNDESVSAAIQSLTRDRCHDLTGKTSLTEAIDLLSQSHAVISNDSGLMHIAAALDKPLIVPYGSTSPDFTPPLGGQVEIVRLGLGCSPCFQRECPLKHHRCMQDLTPILILQALDRLRVSGDARISAKCA